MINIPKGTKDVLPADSYRWQAVEQAARDTARQFCVREIRTPTFEHTELFARGVGDTTDIVNKEMYTFTDKGDRSLTLKPEGTAGVVRAFIENGLDDSLPQKVFYFTPVFRYERPQAGRLREHHQFGVEWFGAAGADTDAELIFLAYTFLQKLGLTELQLRVNSIGCPTCRKSYNEALRAFLSKKADALCPTCNERLARNPLRVLDCKVPACQEAIAGAPRILDYLCPDCQAHFDDLQKHLAV
ncbi:MAG: histidine--tRNA ligase, partial [Clostridiales bacterium]|nr:histidine--tRNA ligase [Clostridiales bacterium]